MLDKKYIKFMGENREWINEIKKKHEKLKANGFEVSEGEIKAFMSGDFASMSKFMNEESNSMIEFMIKSGTKGLHESFEEMMAQKGYKNNSKSKHQKKEPNKNKPQKNIDSDGAIRQGVYLKSTCDNNDLLAEDKTKTDQAIKNLQRRDIIITEEAVLKELEKLKIRATA